MARQSDGRATGVDVGVGDAVGEEDADDVGSGEPLASDPPPGEGAAGVQAVSTPVRRSAAAIVTERAFIGTP
jgi:hypothetical protein